uniref:GTP 3',8-cyclase MoaA n=1 Tax=Ignisphaera aggregans TaxID=334771 RepID=A0A7C4D0I4_9CREN
MLFDRYGRPLSTLRIVVNNECNYKCIYCHKEGMYKNKDGRTLSLEELKVITKIASKLGINRFKISGGEPLLHNDIVDIVKWLNELKPNDISMTTNGFHLATFAIQLAEAGLQRVNIGLPSLNRNKFRYVTGVDALDVVIKGINIAKDVFLKPMTINVVVLKNINEHEYLDFIEFASKFNARLRFIELEPIGEGKKDFNNLYTPLDKIVEFLEGVSIKMYIREVNLRPVYVLDNGVEVEIVRWYRNHKFCLYCDRIRLYSDKTLKPCVGLNNYIDLRKCLEPKIDEDCIESMIIYANTIRKPFWNTIDLA